MAHGYLRDYDEGPDRDEDREYRWNSEQRYRDDRDRRFMFDGSDRENRSREYSREDDPERQRAWRKFSSRQDDHYRTWRDRQVEALDRDYADYCREREQQFHHDFDAWRNHRRGNPQPLQAGMTQTGLSGDQTGEMELTNELVDQSQYQADPMGTATLGTTSDRKRR